MKDHFKTKSELNLDTLKKKLGIKIYCSFLKLAVSLYHKCNRAYFFYKQVPFDAFE